MSDKPIAQVDRELLESRKTWIEGLQRELETANRQLADARGDVDAMRDAVILTGRKNRELTQRNENLLQENSRLVELRRQAEAQTKLQLDIAAAMKKMHEEQRAITIEVVKERDHLRRAVRLSVVLKDEDGDVLVTLENAAGYHLMGHGPTLAEALECLQSAVATCDPALTIKLREADAANQASR